MGTPKDPKSAAAAQALVSTGPQPGERYRHYKGGDYVVIKRTVHSDTLRQMVTYRSLAYGDEWTHFLDDFLQNEIHEGKEVPRFQKIEVDRGVTMSDLNAAARKGFNS
jgi:hypothetical protein